MLRLAAGPVPPAASAQARSATTSSSAPWQLPGDRNRRDSPRVFYPADPAADVDQIVIGWRT